MPRSTTPVILGIESSCDETAAAVLVNGHVRSNVIAGQSVHQQWGGVVPELASRAHQEHIVPVVHQALQEAGVGMDQLDGIAFTRGPGLIGALLVGTCFARSMAQALDVPLLAVDHLQAHILAHLIIDSDARPVPAFPFLNLTVSGGHTLLVMVRGPLDMEVLGGTLDDAAGEAFDKGAKMLGLPYPGGPLIDRLAATGDPKRYSLPLPAIQGFDMSFSGLKAAFHRLVTDLKRRADVELEHELPHLCAALQQAIITILLRKLQKAGRFHGVKRIAISGGVSANSGLRAQVQQLAEREGWEVFIPPLAYCTDNAAMIAMAGHHLYLSGRAASLDVVPMPRHA
ncbi:MAG: tRNA (adenosine(37)-N6)-threonylcarbamoyltransferase complex transferase subunit TsaD [Flavobacteriales bacterium]|nr:tRNA (adenosine(37)-N6)-threonylcarbamoyltransferase complex transferase subunit TsaD [Flavobacteriales bacterium]